MFCVFFGLPAYVAVNGLFSQCGHGSGDREYGRYRRVHVARFPTTGDRVYRRDHLALGAWRFMRALWCAVLRRAWRASRGLGR